MANTFLIVDDDAGVRMALSRLIEERQLGTVLATLDAGLGAAGEIAVRRPDIVLVDLFLPDASGIDIIRQARAQGYRGSFVMISESTSKDIVEKAYEAGVEYYINKPLNAVEITRVIQQVIRMGSLESSVSSIQAALQGLQLAPAVPPRRPEKRDALDHVFEQLGITGVPGCAELRELVSVIREQNGREYRLQTIYQVAGGRLYPNENPAARTKKLEQRVRRILQRVLTNLAGLGNEDYYDPIFCEYASLLFHFSEVRCEMAYLKKTSPYHGKINVKKFLEGLISRLEQ